MSLLSWAISPQPLLGSAVLIGTGAAWAINRLIVRKRTKTKRDENSA